MIRIESISAKDIKNLELKDTPFSRVTLVLGENGYGKSNLLLLLHRLLQTKTMPPEIGRQARFPLEGYVEDGDLLRRGAVSAEANLTVVGHGQAFKKLQSAFLIKDDKKSRNVTLDFGIKEHKPGVLIEVTAIHVGTKKIYPPAEGKPAKAETQAALEAWVREDLAGKTTYVPTARLLKRNLVPYQVNRPANAVDDLENTILRLYTSKAEDAKALDRIKATLKRFFEIDDVRPQLLPPEAQAPVKGSDGKVLTAPPAEASDIGVGIRVREGEDAWFDLDHVGSGIQQVLAIVTMLEESKATIALIEEFETSLSHKNRNRFLQQLVELTGNDKPLAQIITSSHAIFKPKQQDTVLPIGPDKPKVRDRVNFREWTKKDWDAHTDLS